LPRERGISFIVGYRGKISPGCFASELRRPKAGWLDQPASFYLPLSEFFFFSPALRKWTPT
jgi:hypothetical protein